jgi:hypothetical protein
VTTQHSLITITHHIHSHTFFFVFLPRVPALSVDCRADVLNCIFSQVDRDKSGHIDRAEVADLMKAIRLMNPTAARGFDALMRSVGRRQDLTMEGVAHVDSSSSAAANVVVGPRQPDV